MFYGNWFNQTTRILLQYSVKNLIIRNTERVQQITKHLCTFARPGNVLLRAVPQSLHTKRIESMGAYFGFMYEVEYEYARHHKMQCAVCRGVICVSCSVSVNRYVCTPRGTYHISCFDSVHSTVVAILNGDGAMTTTG